MSAWLIKINGASGVSPESLDIVIVGGEFASARPSTVILEAVTDFDGAEVFEYGDEIEITRDGAAFFAGTVRAIPKSADESGERQRYQVEDAWAALEKTIYQEEWSDGPASTVLLPMVYLGIDDTGARITLGEQIEEVVAFAVAAGIDIQAGTIPAGMLLWPTKVTGMSCAEVIRTSLRFHPDWIPWLDHSFSPPKLEVTPRADATARTVAITAADQIDIVETSERVPDCVRVCYLTAAVDGETVLRAGAIDKYPTDGDDSGPGVLTVAVDLAGSSAQIQKQQVQVRTIPVTGDDEADMKDYLRAKFPAIAALDDTDFDITSWATEVVPETETPPDEINAEAPRLVGTTLEHLPRELVKGAVHEWMRKRVGKVKITFACLAEAAATDAEDKLIKSLPPFVIVTATNAVTKIYKGIASWTAAEDAPAGIAQAYYETIANGCRYGGSVPLTESEVGATRYHGCKLHLSGGLSAWSTMGAPIHTVSWNLQTRETVIGFGPNPDLSFGDFLEYLRQLARRPAQWMSGAERTSEELGDTAGPSAAGDNVGPADVPGTDSLPKPSTARLLPYEVHSIRDDSGTWKCKVKTGYVQSNDPGYGASPIMVMPTPTSDETDELTVSASHKIYCKVTTDANDLPTASEIISASSAPTSYHAQPTDTESGGAVGADGVYHYVIADFAEVDDILVVDHIYHIGGSIIHRPGRNDRNFNLEVYGVDTYRFRQGQFVGDEDPESSDPGNLITAIVLGSV